MNTSISACFYFSVDAQKHFINAQNPEICYDDIAKAYSLAKYGSYKDLYFFAKKIYNLFVQQIKEKQGEIWDFFKHLKNSSEYIILLSPGYRNVKASGNIMFDIALPHINSFLTVNNYPIISDVKLLRPMDPCRDYALLSFNEREKMGNITDHILPGHDFFKSGHYNVIYGDDIYITGSSSEKARRVCLNMGAKSFISVFAVMMDQEIANKSPSIEETLNQKFITNRLDHTAYEIYNQIEFIPVLRSLELLLASNNSSNLRKFLDAIPIQNALRVYSAFMGNERIEGSIFKDGLFILRDFLIKHELVDTEGLPVWR